MAVRKYSIEWWVLLGTLVGMGYGATRVAVDIGANGEHKFRSYIAIVARDSVDCCEWPFRGKAAISWTSPAAVTPPAAPAPPDPLAATRLGFVILFVSMVVAVATLVIGRLRHPHSNGHYREIEDNLHGR